MNEEQIERLARRAGKTSREYCFEQIHRWKEWLQATSDDYRGLDDAEIAELTEEEVDVSQRTTEERD